MTTLLNLKIRKTELRNEINAAKIDGREIDEDIFSEYQTVIEHLIAAEEKLLRPVDHCSRCRWLNERNS